MSTQTGSRRQSWRQSGSRAGSGGKGSVRRRKIITAAILGTFVLAALGLIIYQRNIRVQYTRVATLLTASPTKTGAPEQDFAWLPLRFGSESLVPLTAENTEYFQVAALTPSFDDTKNLKLAIDEQLRLLKRDDAFILWIRAKGAEFNGRAYLLNGNYSLPTAGEELINPAGAIPFNTIVEAAAKWTGPVLILLDWGNQLCDPRAGVLDNQFLSLAVQDLKSAPPNIFCLVSHQQGEMSLDSLATQQTLFGRACAEGIVGPRRLPATAESMFYVHDANKLLIGDLAEYVIRRVRTDSAQLQKPWLIQGQSGWLTDDRQNWLAKTRVPLAELRGKQRLLGWSELPTDQGESPAEKSESDKNNVPATGAGVSSAESNNQVVAEGPAGLKLDDKDWPTGRLWQALDSWRVSQDQFGGWSLATLAPLSARQLATQVMFLEHRWLAGNDFRGETNGSDLSEKIEGLLKTTIPHEQEGISNAFEQSSAFAAVLAGKPAAISDADYSSWRQRVDAVSAYRQLALILYDTVCLSDNLAKLDSVSNDLAKANNSGIATVKRFLQQVSASSTESLDKLRLADAVVLTRELQKDRVEIERRIEELVSRAIDAPHTERLLAEVLSRYCWLSQAQRASLLQSMKLVESTDPNAGWPTMDLTLLRPPHRTSATLPTQFLELVKAVTLENTLGDTALTATAPQLVSQLSQAAQTLSKAKQLSEAAWLIVDSRDLFRVGWQLPQAVERQFPAFPTVPQPQPSWQVAWENVTGGQLGANWLQLYSTSEPTKLDFVLTRVGAAADIESVQIQLTGGLQARIASDETSGDTNWLGGAIELSHKDLLRVVDLKANAQRLPLELRALNANPQVPLEVQIRVVAGDDSPTVPPLTCRLPAKVPVELKLQQLVIRDGVTAWEDCDRQESLTTIQPFPGRKTQFRLLVSNADSQPRIASVELYRLPAKSSTNAKGRVTRIEGEVPNSLEPHELRALTSIAKSAPITLEPNAQEIEVDFTPSASPAAEATAPAAAAGAATTPAITSKDKDITWGMLAVVRLQSESTLNWQNWIELRPVRATDFLSASSTVSRDARSINLDVALKDANADGLPDWLPTDFSDDQPIVLACEIGGGIDLQRASVDMPQQTLTKDKQRQVFRIGTEEKIEDEVELHVTVDGSARALFEFVGVGGRAARREPPDRIKLRSIGIKDGLTYLNNFQRNLAENQQILASDGAMFKRPVPSAFDILLAVDAESRGRIGAAPERGVVTLNLPSQKVTIGDFLGDRDLVASLSGTPSKTFSVECQLTDWRFTYDPRALGDVEATFQGSIGSARDQVLAKLVLDGRGPVLTVAPNIPAVVEGRNSQLSFRVVDSLRIGAGAITIGQAGKPALATPNGEKLTSNDFVRTDKGWELRSRTLIVEEMPAGKYDVRAQLQDLLGNSSEFGPWTLEIKGKSAGGNGQAAAQAAKPLKDDINGRIFFGTTKNKSPNPVKVAVKDLPEKTVTSSDGKFKITGLDAGEYTLEASSEWQGTVYKGEAKVKLLKKEDYQKLIDITLVK